MDHGDSVDILLNLGFIFTFLCVNGDGGGSLLHPWYSVMPGNMVVSLRGGVNGIRWSFFPSASSCCGSTLLLSRSRMTGPTRLELRQNTTTITNQGMAKTFLQTGAGLLTECHVTSRPNPIIYRFFFQSIMPHISPRQQALCLRPTT